jgi:hypothetical protein
MSLEICNTVANKKQAMSNWSNIYSLSVMFIEQGKAVNPTFESLNWTEAKK